MKDKNKHLRRPLDQYEYKGVTGAKTRPPVGAWAQEKITQLTYAVGYGNFSQAFALLEELKDKGLQHDGHRPLEVGLDSFVSEVFDAKTTSLLEREFHIHTFRQLMQLPRRRLEAVANFGPATIKDIIATCQRHFGDWEASA